MRAGLILVGALAGLSETAFADDVGPYVYGSVGAALSDFNKAHVDSAVAAAHGGASVVSSVKTDPTTYKVNVGYQLSTSLGIQFGYGSTTSFGYATSAPTLAQASEKLQIWDALLAGSHNIGAGFALTFRGGIANVRATGNGTATHFSGRATEGVGGAGIKYVIDKHLSVRLDWDGFKGPRGSQIGSVNLVSAGFGYNF